MADPASRSVDSIPRSDDEAASPAVSPWAAALALLLHPAAPVAVLLSGALLAWLGSQWPQSQAPLLVADGLARLDLITLAELGFDRLLTSLPLVLWLIAAVAVAAVRWRAATTLRGMASQALWATAALAAASAIAAAPNAPQVWIDVPVEPGAAAVQGWSGDASRLAPASGSWSGQCTLGGTGQQLSCKIEAQGRSWLLELAPGRPSRQDGFQWTWMSSGPALGSRVWDASWPAATGQPPALVRLNADRPVDAPAVATRLLPVATRAAGPLVLALPNGAEAQLWTASPLAPQVAPTAQARTAPVVRLHMAAVAATTWLWVLALAAAAAAVASGAALPLKRRS